MTKTIRVKVDCPANSDWRVSQVVGKGRLDIIVGETRIEMSFSKNMKWCWWQEGDEVCIQLPTDSQ